ncbi:MULTISPECIES: LPS-assembly protein LptD [Ramlibacter]|uniref:LPS-assembly protein LptD n=1 Tax=Ramlibacter pinisoli TaxID=2682844 RepID=A0A6N8J138_9BURK|nr:MULTISPECIES: LPS-assembly protein LptD [Ramlibacter]MBA2962864.1 LPS-assembly protein LptD [Ramlibacter sp. CGMCC 1.13660]MVQ32807.1 LPS assembly protein LptD [Ramlibacter pinisoli]
MKPTPRNRFAPTPLALVACWLVHGGAALAQSESVDAAGVPLRRTPLLREQLPAAQKDQLPTFVQGDRVTGRTDFETIVEGGAELRRGDTVIKADRLEYYQPDDLAKARGNVRINRQGNVYRGPQLELKVDAFEGFFNQPSYEFLRNGAYGQADRVDFIDDKRSVVRNATYTTCRPQDLPGWTPDWIMRAASIRLDDEEDTGTATNAVLTFFSMPVLPIPQITFPLSDRRKSGFLPPTFGIDSVSGFEYRQPYYWNIAPNRDATLLPRVLSKRGVELGGEFRYLEPSYNGQLQANVLPGDKLRDRLRWGYSYRHDGVLQETLSAGRTALSLNLNRVSDDDYWRDFTRSSASLTQRLLPSDGILAWARGYWYASARALQWQTLQDVTAPITPPYDRMPQLYTRYARPDLDHGLVASLEADTTRFNSVRELTLQPNAQRSFLLGRIERPWQAPGWFITPRFQVHSATYSFDAPLANGETAAARTVPTFSLDSGLVFERPAAFFGRAVVQTLEPRAFYVYTPFRDQSQLPNYDSAANDFNFATIYTENPFGGYDRIADNNLLTLGVTSRLIEPDTGAELARFGFAQRLRFQDQLVTLPGVAPVTERVSDLLLGASLNWIPKWSLDSTLQYNPNLGRSERTTIGGRYNPSNYRLVSAAYRLQRDFSEQVDVGWQWPINDLWGDRGQDLGPGRGQGPNRWYSVGRLNWSLKDRRLVDAVVGLEYDACCWIGRVVLERLSSTVTTAATRILFQIEFVGFSRLGSSVVTPLRQNIPRYQLLRDPNVLQPSRFSNYD